jgi:hypothetical protein
VPPPKLNAQERGEEEEEDDDDDEFDAELTRARTSVAPPPMATKGASVSKIEKELADVRNPFFFPCAVLCGQLTRDCFFFVFN